MLCDMLSVEWSGFVLNVNVTGKLCAHERRGGKSAELRMDFLLDHDVVAVVGSRALSFSDPYFWFASAQL